MPAGPRKIIVWGFPEATAKHKSLGIERDGSGPSGLFHRAQARNDLMAGGDQTKSTTHEVFSREEKIVAGSDRSFGFVMAGAFALLTLLNAWHEGRIWPWSGGLAALFLAAALIRPAMLNPLNRIWLKFGLLLHRIVNPVIMALLFFGTVLPTGLVMRALGKDLLRLKRQPDADSYWIVRQPPGPSPETMKDQF
jgi:hypothetical protein